MNSEQEHHVPTSKAGDEVYSISDLQMQSDYVASRTAAHWVGFFLPHLRAGMRLLDCGCGVGTITLDLAQIVSQARSWELIVILINWNKRDHWRSRAG